MADYDARSQYYQYSGAYDRNAANSAYAAYANTYGRGGYDMQAAAYGKQSNLSRSSRSPSPPLSLSVISLSLPPSLSLCHLALPLSLSVISLSLPLSLSLGHLALPPSLSVCLSLTLSLYLALPLPLSISLSLSLSLVIFLSGMYGAAAAGMSGGYNQTPANYTPARAYSSSTTPMTGATVEYGKDRTGATRQQAYHPYRRNQ